MAQKPTKWTDRQLRAITARGADVLVSASAGTGKTAVLSGRCADIVSDKEICPDVRSILVLTFTEMAADQMRRRIAEQLRARLLKKKDSHLRYQLVLLQGADISTIHSFCKRLITEYFYKLDLDPTFTVIDDDERVLLQAEVLEKTLDWAWEQSHLADALGQLFRGRQLQGDGSFASRIIDVSNFLDSVTSRRNWYQRASVLSEAIEEATGELGTRQKEIVFEKLQCLLNRLRDCQKLYLSQSPAGSWAQECDENYIKPVTRCIELIEDGDWDHCAEQIRNLSKPTVKKPKDVPSTIGELIKKTVSNGIASFASLSELAIVHPDYMDKIAGTAGLQTKVLLELVKRFDQFYNEAKNEINCLDFADLEHYALRLLTVETDSSDSLVPSETALALRNRYKFIFVDEYQDINPVQQAILDSLSCKGNVFAVGDVKQSIYAFRGAKPEIFIEHLKPASYNPQNAQSPLRVDLTTNWRSRKEILNFVNQLFGRIMKPDIANLTYDESAELKPPSANGHSNTAPSDRDIAVELHILDQQNQDPNAAQTDRDKHNTIDNLPAISSRQRQAALIARRIKQMVGAETAKPEFEIFDEQLGRFRPVEYRDIVILLRSPFKRANEYVEILRQANIPVSHEGSVGYFEKTEISDCLCFLKVLDNPLRDIELAALLRSPFFGVSDTELAEVKILSKKQNSGGSFYEQLRAYGKRGPDIELAAKVRDVLDRIERWRLLALRSTLPDLVWRIFRETGYLSFVSALPNGRERRANLLKLHDRAIQFESFASSGGAVSLARFVGFIEKLQQSGQDWAGAEPEADAYNAVRVISVHKSKGLEFPVVFLAELENRFNFRDISDDCLAHPRYALGLQIIDPDSNSKIATLAHQVIAEEKRRTSLAEEMRILYVATTRAKERLVLSAHEKTDKCRDIITAGLLFGTETIPDWQLRNCQNHLEWILYGLSNQKNLHTAFQTSLQDKCQRGDLFAVKLYNQKELRRLSEWVLNLRKRLSPENYPNSEKAHAKEKEIELLPQVKKSLYGRYRYGDAPLLPAKRSVTQLTHYNDQYLGVDYSGSLYREPKAAVSPDVATIPDSRLLGIATHLVISRLDLTANVDKKSVERTIEQLSSQASISEDIAGRIDANAIAAFFQSKLGKRFLAAYPHLWREWPFSFALKASLLPKAKDLEIIDCPDENVIVQGIIDMLARTPTGLVIVDFKTDNITAAQVADRAKAYYEQLELYARAAKTILKAEHASKWLYFLKPSCAFEV